MVETAVTLLSSIDDAEARLQNHGYVPSRDACVAALLMDRLEKPLLVEGPAGVGKTELAKALSRALDRPLIRLQCYEGLDESRALYEWEYGKQLLYTEMLRPIVSRLLSDAESLATAIDRIAREESALFSPRFLLERPLLRALSSERPALLLIDEVDRADPEFEALLLEFLSDFQVSIPELSTFKCVHKPRVVLTTNGTREMTDALRRRCLYLHLDYPEPSRELAILTQHVPHASSQLREQIVNFVQRARALDLRKAPSIAETVDWAETLVLLSADNLDAAFVRDSLGALAKHREDIDKLDALLSSAALP
jgi:MoxR-like ATPase